VLTSYERNYSATKKELLAVIFSLRKFKEYLYGIHFTLLTDHRALVFLLAKKHDNLTLNAWLDVLLEYNFTVVHIPGIKNTLPDALSRSPAFEPVVNQLSSLTLSTTSTSRQTVAPSPPILPSKEEKRSTIKPERVPFIPSHIVGHDRLMILMEAIGKKVPEEGKRADLVRKAHEFGHFGEQAVFHALWNQQWYWPGMRRDIAQVIDECLPCLQFNIGRRGFHPLRSITATLPWDHVAMDLVGPLPISEEKYEFILVITDVFTRFSLLRPLRSKAAKEVALCLWENFCSFGVPKILQSDQGSEFVNEVIRNLLQSVGISHRLIAAYSPSTNGVVERINAVIMSTLKKSLKGAQNQWPLYVPYSQLSFNQKISSLTGSSPFSLLFGRKLNELEDFAKNSPLPTSIGAWKRSFQRVHELVYPVICSRVSDVRVRQQKDFDKAFRIVKDAIPVGSMVMAIDLLKSGKLDPLFEGPFTVKRINASGTYVLQDSTGELLKKDFPVQQLKLVKRTIVDQDDAYVVSRVSAHRGSPGRYEYLTHWEGYSDPTWEPTASFLDHAVLKKYWRSQAKA